MTTVSTYLDTLVRETQKSEAEVVAQAFETGLRQLWREYTLGRYLRGQITRAEAIEVAGLDWVELAERQYQAMTEDLAWGFAA
jgi:hypothetical protein